MTTYRLALTSRYAIQKEGGLSLHYPGNMPTLQDSSGKDILEAVGIGVYFNPWWEVGLKQFDQFSLKGIATL